MNSKYSENLRDLHSFVTGNFTIPIRSHIKLNQSLYKPGVAQKGSRKLSYTDFMTTEQDNNNNNNIY